MTKFQVRRAVKSAREALMCRFVPENLGFSHISRDSVIQNHTRPLAKELFCSDPSINPAVLVLDGTYIYIQKSGNFTFSRRSYSVHKHRPLVKAMMVVTSSGYIVSVLGPYLADFKNNDANILKHMIRTNTEEIKEWVQDNDIFVVDRGFRDAKEVLSDLGISMEMPSFLQRGNKQHTTEESNVSRLVTKVRWVVEAVNGRIKNWRYLDRILPNTQIPFIGSDIRIVSALCNKYRPPLSSGDSDADLLLAAKMLHLSHQSNALQLFVEENNLEKGVRKWQKVDSSEVAQSFPVYDEDQLRELILGIYQLKMAKSYAHEHFDDDGGYEILVNEDMCGIVCANIQSRHTSSKKYLCWIRYDEGVVTAWYCKCKAGSRVVGACAHITSVVWYLSHGRYNEKEDGVRNWSSSVEDAGRLPDPIDESESEEDNGTVEE